MRQVAIVLTVVVIALIVMVYLQGEKSKGFIAKAHEETATFSNQVSQARVKEVQKQVEINTTSSNLQARIEQAIVMSNMLARAHGAVMQQEKELQSAREKLLEQERRIGELTAASQDAALQIETLRQGLAASEKANREQKLALTECADIRLELTNQLARAHMEKNFLFHQFNDKLALRAQMARIEKYGPASAWSGLANNVPSSPAPPGAKEKKPRLELQADGSVKLTPLAGTNSNSP